MVSVKLLVEGGNMKPSPAVAQQIGPMGINMSKVISDINEKTGNFKGMNVPVILDVDGVTKNYTITVKSPPTSELLKKEVGISKGTGARLKSTSGDIAFERIISVALQKHDNMLSHDLMNTIKSVLGTCQAMGVIVDNKEIKDIMSEVNSGKYDAMISAKKTEVDEEKENEIKSYFDNLNKKQSEVSATIEEAATASAAGSKSTSGSAKPGKNKK
jgi:large subunit ribosomal protein L11